jgi:hypothetical protein
MTRHGCGFSRRSGAGERVEDEATGPNESPKKLRHELDGLRGGVAARIPDLGHAEEVVRSAGQWLGQ